jgi:hypothetical protein
MLKADASAIDEDLPTSLMLPIKELCVNGDLVLLVGEDFGSTHQFRVCRNTLCMASPVWRAMLSGEFVEAKLGEIPFADDDPDALLLVLRIAHLRFHEIPQQMTRHKLVEVATICDKYDTVAMCRPFIRDWMKPWLKVMVFNRPGNEEFLWITWVFGYAKEFTRLAKYLQTSIYTDDAGNYIANGVKIEILDNNMPPDLFGRSSFFT